MTDTTLKNAFFTAGSVNPALKAVANTQNAAQTTAAKTQDFGTVLDKTAQKLEQKPVKAGQTTADSSADSKTQQSEKGAVETKMEETGAAAEEAVSESAKEEKVTDSSQGAVGEPARELSDTEEPVDQKTIDEIANVLEQILSQIKEILGITDEELFNGMEELGLQPCDLLNADNMAQLVAAVAGEGSAISFVADEELYTALQDITQMVDTQVDSLLEKTNLTDEELDAVLQKLQELENQSAEEQLLDAGISASEGQGTPAVDEAVNTAEISETAETIEEQDLAEPVIIKEDNTKSGDQSAKQYDTLPENQQENPAELVAKPQTQSAGKDAKDSDARDSKDFGQNSTAQNFQNNLNEVTDTAAVTEGIAKFTSESTENIMRQLADMVKIVRNENLTEMELQLHPASLGTVNVSLTTKGGIVTAEFTTQNEAVKAAIEAQASQLRANLEEQGVKIEAIEVSVESHQMERDLDKNGDQQQRQAQEQETTRIQGMRRGRSSINLRAFANGEEPDGGIQGADDATRIAMEMMAANGNTMDLLA